MSTVFSNVNLNRIDFVDGGPDIRFEFIDSIHGSHKYIGEIICKHITLFKMDTSFDSLDDYVFPCFLCDVIVNRFDTDISKENTRNYHEIKMLGGEISVTVFCGTMEISKV